ncbi:MAG: HAMP domain-containing histidine kinase [Coriobacteriia bacterium]|nr:HAMP domain-containing histidine kinase [Coriobacteriia bacterium]
MLIACIIISAALAAALIWILLLKRDIRQLATKLKQIVGVDTNANVTTSTFDKDIAMLAENVNIMLERNRCESVLKNRAEADLKRAITNISHDLRTPLTSALGNLQMLESGDLDEDTRLRYLKTASGRLEALSGLMNNLFEFTQIIEGRTNIVLQKVNICNALRDTLSAYYAELGAKGFIVDVVIPDTPAICYCDGDLLRRVLQSLMKNVCVHGRDFLHICLYGNSMEIANKADNLDELDTERIFERFYTADASRTSKNTGLGLAISKELITQMNGTIHAAVEGELLVMRISLMSE